MAPVLRALSPDEIAEFSRRPAPLCGFRVNQYAVEKMLGSCAGLTWDQACARVWDEGRRLGWDSWTRAAIYAGFARATEPAPAEPAPAEVRLASLRRGRDAIREECARAIRRNDRTRVVTLTAEMVQFEAMIAKVKAGGFDE